MRGPLLLLLLVSLAGSLGGCSMAPQGLLGVKWGDDAAHAAEQLGLRCPGWEPWEGGKSVSTCFSTEHKVALFGEEAYARLFSRDGQLLAVSLRFPGCDERKCQSLREQVRREFQIGGAAAEDPYHVYWNHAVVHFSADASDQSCTLTVAGPAFGKEFESYVLAQGLGHLGRSLTPGH